MSVFTFKQFTIAQHHSSHKVGTDGVLLGAWATRILQEDFLQILDIGTGTGVIGLMMAQAFPLAQITAIEPDIPSIEDASLNFASSPWQGRIDLHTCTLADYFSISNFDLIISNPPYYREHTLSPDLRRAAARNIASLSPEKILEFAARHLKKEGYLCLILPFYHFEDIQKYCKRYHLFLVNICTIFPKNTKKANRILLCISPMECHTIASQLIIYKEDNTYTTEYIELCCDFYLYM